MSVEVEDRRRIRVVGQCKAEKKKMGPNYVRELEGVVFRFLATSSDATIDPPLPPQISTSPVVALLISQSPFTKSTLVRAQSSPIPSACSIYLRSRFRCMQMCQMLMMLTTYRLLLVTWAPLYATPRLMDTRTA